MRKIRNNIAKPLTLLLIAALVFVGLPTQGLILNANADTEVNPQVSVPEMDSIAYAEDNDVYILAEDVSKRGEFEKHYLCSDGTYVVATYAEAVHYKDSNGEWIDINNRPTQTTTGNYTTRSGDYFISVPASADEGHLMCMNKGEHSFSWTLSASKRTQTALMDSNTVNIMSQKPIQSHIMQVCANSRPEVMISNGETNDGFHGVLRGEATFDLPNISSKVEYHDLFGVDEGVSVVYTIYHNKIEEDIYIERPTDITSFSMEVETPELTPRLNEDNSIDFLDNSGKACYHIGIPYMVDANFAVLSDIETTVTHLGESWIISYTPNAAWFTSEERVYPILLDPSITTDEYRSAISDTYVEQNSTVNHSNEQFLYINGGTGYRKAVIRINQMPMIDDTMPLISAKMNFVAQYAPFSDVSLTLDYITGNRSIGISAYTYEDASKTADCSAGYILSAGLTGVSFNLTNHIYEILDSPGDFVLGYSTEGDNTYCYPFHSSESTTGTGPILTVTYGYSLPDGVADGAILALQNCGSTLFASVSGTNPAEYANIYQVDREDWIPTTNELFRLQYNAETGGYRLYSMASDSGTNRMLTVYTPTNGLIYGSRNVRLEDLDDHPEISQDWMIVSNDGSTFRIFPRSNMSVCLTVNGDTEGTSSGTGTSAAGNVCVKSVDTSSDYQLWWLANATGYIYTSEYIPATLDNGLYYFINRYSGRYLYLSGNTAMSTRGFMTDTRANNNVSDTSASLYQVYREFITWRITNLGDGYCTIQNPFSMAYLYAQTGTNGEIHSNRYVKVGTLDDSIPDKYKWRIYIAPGGGMLFKNKLGDYYLTLNESSLQTRNANVRMYGKYSSSSTGFGQQVWRVFKQEDYVEPTGLFTLSIPSVDINEQQAPTVTAANGSCSLNKATDFYYTASNTNISVDSINGTITGLVSGTATVTPTHKTTGFVCSNFTVKVNRNAIIIIPGIMGTELIAGHDNSSYAYGTKLWSTSMIDDYEAGVLSEMDLVNRVISLRCNSNGESINDIIPYNNTYGAGNVYESLYSDLHNEYQDEYAIEFFAYDWRLSNATSANSLNAFINDNGYDKVILVCHSMGGLVASGYLSLGSMQQNKVKKVITLGSPLLGTPVVPYLWGSEDIDTIVSLDEAGIPEFGKWLIDKVELYYNLLDYLIGNFSSMYEMFPSEKYFNDSYAGKTYLVTTILGSGTLNITTYEDTKDRLNSYLSHYNTNLANLAEDFHDSLYTGSTHVTELVSTYYIAGYNISTIEKVEFDMWDWYSYSDTYDGDSLVPTWSATLGDRSNSRTFYVKNVSHMGLVSNIQTKQFVIQLIAGNTSTTSFTDIHTDMIHDS